MADPNVPQNKPYVMEIDAGTYAWCACGQSNNQPYCDGSHKGTDFNPVIENVDEPKRVAWCGCKHSGSAPFCDGSHTDL